MAKKVLIRDLKHHVALCTSTDTVVDGSTMMLVREDVLRTWAKIEPRSSSMFSRAGYNILEDREKQTHLITMRMRRDIDISSAAWIYEQRMQSGARWFKVLGYHELGDDGDFWVFSARLIERGENLVPPVADATEEIARVVDHGIVL